MTRQIGAQIMLTLVVSVTPATNLVELIAIVVVNLVIIVMVDVIMLHLL
jgi:hypothetical protein